MKKFSILALSLMLAFAFAACSSSADVKTVDTAKKVETKVDPKIACKADCDKAADVCTKAAGKDKKKAAACDAAKVKCAADCDKTKVAEPVKKAAVKK